MTITEDRYRMLLGASSALADQPTVKAVLQSLRGVLSSTSRLHGAELCLLSDDGESLFTFEFDRDADAPAIKRGSKLLRVGVVAQALDEQKPVFVPDLSPVLLEHPDMAPFAAEVCRTQHLFVPSIHRAKTLRNSVNTEVEGPAICAGRCRDAQCHGFAGCHRAGVRLGKGSGRAVST